MDGWPILAWPVPEDRRVDLDTEAQWEEAERLARTLRGTPGHIG